jgi:adenylate kinase
VLIVLLGPPGAGKGTQSQLLAQSLGVPKVATGDIFREAIARETPLGVQAKPYLDRGELVPGPITTEMVKSRLQREDCRKGAILDGYPRTVEQARQFDAVLRDIHRGLSKVINIDVPDDELLRRLSGRWTCRKCQSTFHEIFKPSKNVGACDRCGGTLYQRPDDSIEVAQTRLRVYRTRTEPVIAYYQEQGVLVHVDGQQTPDSVLSDILSRVQVVAPS